MKILKQFENFFTNFSAKMKQKSMIRKYESALARTQSEITNNFQQLQCSKKMISEVFYQELEELLVSADIDYRYTVKIIAKVKKRIQKTNITYRKEAIEIIIDEILATFVSLQELDYEIQLKSTNEISCMMFCGVNGGGKTTTVIKVAHLLQKKYQRKVMVIAADIFRVGAIAQLAIHAKRNKIPIYIDHQSKRASSVVYDGIKVAQQKGCDVVLIDTSGRLHNNSNLLSELEKINKAAEKSLGCELTEKLLIVDATNGQSIIQQVEGFDKSVGVTGIVLTKLDSSARGGAILSVMDIYKKPTKFIGTGEKITDLSAFDIGIFLYEILKFIKI